MKLTFAVTATFIVTSSSALSIDYGQLMTNKVRDALGRKAVQGYTFATYPLDNYGLGTAYERKVNAAKQLCATWDCLGITDSKQLAGLTPDEKLNLMVKGVQYADVG